MALKNSTVRKEIFKSAILFSLIIMTAFGVLLSIILYRMSNSKAIDIIKQRNYAVNYFIDGYFAEINNTIEILSTDLSVQTFPRIDSPSQDRVLQLYRNYTDVNANITYIYSGYETGELIINDYIPPEDYDPRVRPWYVSAMTRKPDLSTGIPYREAKSREWLLSTSKALIDENGIFSGVVSCDSSIEMVTDILSNQLDEIYESSFSYVTTPDGEIILHHDKSYIKKTLPDLIDTSLDFSGREGLFHYSLEGVDKIAYYSRCEEADWLVITVVEKQEIIGPIFRRIFSSIVLTSLIAVFVGLIQSSMLSNRFSKPIQELLKRVKAVVDGRREDNHFIYPDNEIGIMAEEISQLAVTELYRKSNELENVNSQLREKNSELINLSVTDQLTGLYNRRKMDEEMELCIQVYRRHKRIFSLIIFDIDLFKQINDDLGHQSGDDVLKVLAELIRENLRPSDVACRWGGEEFLILCAETDLKQADVLGRRLCSIIENHDFRIDRKVTVSCGVSECREDEDSHAVLKRADDNLYRAKGEGRNRIFSQ